MGVNVAVAFLVPVVLGDIVEVVPADDDGALHLGRQDDALQDTSADGHVAGEGAFLIDVGALDGLLGGLEVQAHVLVVPHTSARLFGQQFLAVQEDAVLLLESAFVLSQQSSTWISAMVTNIKYFN